MKNFKYIYIVLSLLFASCFEDKGNYDYIMLEEIKIDNIETTYPINIGETLEIKPEVTNPDNYTYIWMLVREVTEGTSTTQVRDTLSRVKDLSYVIHGPQEIRPLYYSVTDKSNGSTKLIGIRIEVTTVYSRGWYFLKDENNMTDMDFFNENEEKTENIIKFSLGESMKGNAVNLCSELNINNNAKKMVLLPISTEEVHALRIEDMSSYSDYKGLFYGKIPNSTPLNIQYGNRFFNSIITAEGVHHSGARSLIFTDPVSTEGEVVPSKWTTLNNYGSMIYDTKNYRFIWKTSSGILETFSHENDNNTIPAHGFNPNNLTNMSLLTMSLIGVYDSYVLMKDDTDNSVKIIDLDYSGFCGRTKTYYNPIRSVINVNNIYNNINNETLCCNNKFDPIIYYADKNSINMISCTDGQVIPNIIVYPDGEYVTFMKHIHWSKTDGDHNFNYFVVATYKDDKYKVYMYELRAGKPDPDKDVIIREGNGRIASMHYISPIMGSINSSSYPFY